MLTTASWTLTLESVGGSPQPIPIETTGGWPSRVRQVRPGLGSHCLLFSSPSGLLYLNDDFQGGDLFFTEPNALTVRVSEVGVGGWGV